MSEMEMRSIVAAFDMLEQAMGHRPRQRQRDEAECWVCGRTDDADTMGWDEAAQRHLCPTCDQDEALDCEWCGYHTADPYEIAHLDDMALCHKCARAWQVARDRQRRLGRLR